MEVHFQLFRDDWLWLNTYLLKKTPIKPPKFNIESVVSFGAHVLAAGVILGGFVALINVSFFLAAVNFVLRFWPYCVSGFFALLLGFVALRLRERARAHRATYPAEQVAAFRKNLAKQYRELEDRGDSCFDHHYTYRIGPDGFTMITDYGLPTDSAEKFHRQEVQFKWRSIEFTEITGSMVCIQMKSLGFAFVPRSAFPDDKECLRFVHAIEMYSAMTETGIRSASVGHACETNIQGLQSTKPATTQIQSVK